MRYQAERGEDRVDYQGTPLPYGHRDGAHRVGPAGQTTTESGTLTSEDGAPTRRADSIAEGWCEMKREKTGALEHTTTDAAPAAQRKGAQKYGPEVEAYMASEDYENGKA